MPVQYTVVAKQVAGQLCQWPNANEVWQCFLGSMDKNRLCGSWEARLYCNSADQVRATKQVTSKSCYTVIILCIFLNIRQTKADIQNLSYSTYQDAFIPRGTIHLPLSNVMIWPQRDTSLYH